MHHTYIDQSINQSKVGKKISTKNRYNSTCKIQGDDGTLLLLIFAPLWLQNSIKKIQTNYPYEIIIDYIDFVCFV